MGGLYPGKPPPILLDREYEDRVKGDTLSAQAWLDIATAAAAMLKKPQGRA